MYVVLHEEFIDPGARAVDDIDGDISKNVISENNVDVDNMGDYHAIYSVSDAAGNKAEKERIVKVGIFDSIPPEIYLLGPNPMLLDYKTEFNDPGACAIDNLDDSIPFDKFTVDNTVDINTLGTYTVTYRVKDNVGNEATADRQVDVIDTIPPQITIHGENPVILEIDNPYVESGATAVDNYDGDVTGKLDTLGEVNTTVEGSYEIRYKVTDSNNNKALAVRKVEVRLDMQPPTIILLGYNPMSVAKEDTFIDPGAFAVDNIDDTIPFSKFTVTDNIDMNTIGAYTVNYSVNDSVGNTATATRDVNVIDSILHHTDTITLSMRTLIKAGDKGEDGGRVGGESRGKMQNYSFETLMYDPLDKLKNKVIVKTLIQISVSDVDFSSSGETATLYEQDQGPYASDATYNTYPNTAWTKELGKITAEEDTVYEISGQELSDLVQSWSDGAVENAGMILGGSFGFTVEWTIDKCDFIVEWYQP